MQSQQLSNLGNLQIDKSVREYCENVWNTPQVEVPKPALSKDDRVRSSNNLLLFGLNNGSKSQDFKNQLLTSSDDDSASLTKEVLEAMVGATEEGQTELLAQMLEGGGGELRFIEQNHISAEKTQSLI